MPVATEASSTRDMIARRNRLLGPAYRLFYEEPVEFVRGEGVWLYDASGHQVYPDPTRPWQKKRVRQVS